MQSPYGGENPYYCILVALICFQLVYMDFAPCFSFFIVLRNSVVKFFFFSMQNVHLSKEGNLSIVC